MAAAASRDEADRDGAEIACQQRAAGGEPQPGPLDQLRDRERLTGEEVPSSST